MANGTPKTRLELTWIGKENRPRLEPRILLGDSSKSYHAKRRHGPNDQFDNRLIFGDNLLALKALEQEFAGKIKCIYIDPPYNTGSAFTHYDDGIEHSLWLSLMRDRLEILRRLLAADGSIWVNLDDNEAHYAKVLMDEVFGRANFVANVIWEKVYSARMDAKGFSASHDHIFVYSKSEAFVPRRMRIAQNDKQFSNFDERADRWFRRRSLRKEGSGSLRADRPNLYYALKAPDGTDVYPVKPDGIEGRWRWERATYDTNQAEGLVEWIHNGTRWEVYVKQYKEEEASRPPETLWNSADVGHNHEAKEEARSFNASDVFGTPKPERLIERVLMIASNPGDWVLDSFAGSGTTGAVAHKMGRRWIMVELGEHCHTHIIPRLVKVIDGADAGGVTEATGWKGGGGFRYSRLGPSLLQKDKFKNWIINGDYNAAMLTEAVCKLEGFVYAPSDSVYWQHGHSTERDFIYITTQTLTRDMIQKLSDEVGPERSLLVLCKAFRGKPNFPNVTMKKIPKAILHRCEWGKDDYSLEIKSLPPPPPEDNEDLYVQSPRGKVEPKAMAAAKSARRKAAAALSGDGGSLFVKGGG